MNSRSGAVDRKRANGDSTPLTNNFRALGSEKCNKLSNGMCDMEKDVNRMKEFSINLFAFFPSSLSPCWLVGELSSVLVILSPLRILFRSRIWILLSAGLRPRNRICFDNNDLSSLSPPEAFCLHFRLEFTQSMPIMPNVSIEPFGKPSLVLAEQKAQSRGTGLFALTLGWQLFPWKCFWSLRDRFVITAGEKQ